MSRAIRMSSHAASLAASVTACAAFLVPVPARAADAEPTGPLRMEDAVALVLSRNERARISDLNVVVADAAVEKARAGFLPILSFNSTDTQTAVIALGQPRNVGTGGLVLNQPLLNASAFPLYAQARALADAQQAQNIDDKRLLAFSAASAFFAVLSAQAVATAAQHQLDNSKANLSDTQARVQAQLNSSNDVTRAEVDMAGAGRELELDQGALDNSYIQLAYLLNAPVPRDLAEPTPTLTAAEQAHQSLDSLVKFALDHRPDILVSTHQTRAAHDFADEPLLRLVPTIGLTAAATGTTNAPQTTKAWNQETLAATLNWTLYDAGSRYADKHSRDAQAEIADLNLHQLVRNVDGQVRSAAALLAAAQGAFRVASQAMTAARQNVDETAILYKQGLAKAIELIDANDSRFTAEVAYASAEYSMAVAYLSLRQALGQGPIGTELAQ